MNVIAGLVVGAVAGVLVGRRQAHRSSPAAPTPPALPSAPAPPPQRVVIDVSAAPPDPA